MRVAESDDGIVGVIALSFDRDRAEVEHLWVDPDAMGEGLGRALFEEAAALARERGAKRIDIDADPNAERFYEKLGARRVGATPSHPPGRSLPRLVFTLDA